MKKYSITLITIALVLIAQTLFAQSENTDFMRSIGKIYVVVAVIISMFIGIVIYMYRVDQKLTKLENQIIENGKS